MVLVKSVFQKLVWIKERERELKMLGQNEVCLAPINKSSVSEASQRVKAIMLQLSVAWPHCETKTPQLSCFLLLSASKKKILDKPPIFPQTGEKQMTSSLRNTFT